ncbi:hypothetical protein Tco_1015669 [Tanacetum coccineum]|uniref:Uncharacterized protein n=1 Tax=Tanacetum coccineum TaxID=301880 RepID=A0ABQ5FMJ1_9ASTR
MLDPSPEFIGHLGCIGYLEMCSADHLLIALRGTKSGEENFRNYANDSGLIGGERFSLKTHFDKYSYGPRELYLFLCEPPGNGSHKSMPPTSRFHKLGWSFEASHPVAKFFLVVGTSHSF